MRLSVDIGDSRLALTGSVRMARGKLRDDTAAVATQE
jgi:hypothetical protein